MKDSINQRKIFSGKEKERVYIPVHKISELLTVRFRIGFVKTKRKYIVYKLVSLLSLRPLGFAGSSTLVFLLLRLVVLAGFNFALGDCFLR